MPPARRADDQERGGHPAEPRPAGDRRAPDAAGGELGLAGVGSDVRRGFLCGLGPGIEHQWRSGPGITAAGAAVYAAGPALDPLQFAQLLVRAGVVRGMQLDINPNWPDFVSYDPPASAPAGPSSGRRLLSSTVQGPSTFFESWWARDFITMSVRPVR
jgi:hypothetical protein